MVYIELTGNNEKKNLPTHCLPTSTCAITCSPNEPPEMTEMWQCACAKTCVGGLGEEAIYPICLKHVLHSSRKVEGRDEG